MCGKKYLEKKKGRRGGSRNMERKRQHGEYIDKIRQIKMSKKMERKRD